MKVVYGHTDSIYVEMPMDKTAETLAILNNHVRGLFPNLLGLEEHPVTLEFEKYYQSLGVGITKNRNAGLISWKDGKYLDEPEFVMTGFSAKRVAITGLAKETQLQILKDWVGGKSEEEITTDLKTQYNHVLNGKYDVKKLINRSRFRPERFEYKCKKCNKKYDMQSAINQHKVFSASYCSKCGEPLVLVTEQGKNPSIGAGVEGIVWYNQVMSNSIDDSFVYIKARDDIKREKYIHPITGVAKRPTYIAAQTMDELIDLCKPDLHHYAESIIKKALPIYKAMNWDTDPIKQDVSQTQLDEWW